VRRRGGAAARVAASIPSSIVCLLVSASFEPRDVGWLHRGRRGWLYVERFAALPHCPSAPPAPTPPRTPTHPAWPLCLSLRPRRCPQLLIPPPPPLVSSCRASWNARLARGWPLWGTALRGRSCSATLRARPPSSWA
jgi:hypothetical protein